MNSSNFRFSLDLHSLHSQVTIPAFHGDTSITLYITLTDGGKPYTLAVGSLAKITIKRPTGTFLEDFCMIKDNLTIVYPFAQNEGTCAVEGINECDITVYAPNGGLVGSPRFAIMVAEKVMKREDIIIADEDYKIVEAMARVEGERQLAENGRVEAEDARDDAETARVVAERGRVSAEEERAAEEAARAEAEAERVESELGRADAERARVAADKARDEAVEEVANTVLSTDAAATSLASDAEATAAVTLVGEGEERRFHFAFGIPKGKQGIQGPQGLPGVPGIQGPQGKPFGLAKIYASEAAMNADFNNPDIAVGDFVMINTGDVDDEENSRIYVKKESAYSYVTDMSGAAGIQGPAGPQGVPGNTPYIGSNGNWWVGGEDTGESARGVTAEEFDELVEFVGGFRPQIDANTSLLENHSNDIEHLREQIEGIEIPEAESGLPEVTTSDNGKVLTVVGGKWEAKNAPSGGGGGGGVSSWNDLTDKPFGEENAVIFEGEFQFEQIDDDGDGVNDMWAPLSVIEDTSDNTLLAGKAYTLTWDGTEYELECFEAYGVLAIGNTVISGGEDNGCPVVLTRDLSGDLVGSIGWEAAFVTPQTDLTTSGRYACKIEVASVKQLDNKYLGILAYTEGTGAETETELLPKTTEETVFNSAFDAYAITKSVSVEMTMFLHGYGEEKLEGTVYVDFDGVTYACEPQSVAALDNAIGVGNFTLFGGTGNNEPFAISILADLGDEVSPGGLLMVGTFDTSPTEHTVRIYQKTEGVAGGYKVKHEYPLEQPVSIDMSAFESEGKIVETYADGTSKTTVVELNGIGNPSKITDSDGNVIQFMW